MHFWIWLALSGGFLVIEILTMSLFFLSFALAALIGALTSALWENSPIQWIGFSIAAVLTLVIIRPIMKKYLFKDKIDSRTGVEALLHAPATAITEITTSAGFIKLNDETWSARSMGAVIPEASMVEVVAINGAVAMVALKNPSLSS